MDLEWDDELVAYRAQVRTFLAAHWPPRSKDKATREDEQKFREHAIAQGYLYRGVPTRFGGSEQAADPLKAQIIRDEFQRVHAPQEVGGMGTDMLVPTLLERGKPWQQEQFIPKTLTGEYLWAQGYSEPSAGSDLASLRTRAQLVGGEWVINGQKIWTTRAHLARYMFALVRTEPEASSKHARLSYLLLDLKQPGVEIRQLKQMTGAGGFSEVFFRDARTPADWIVGERGQGWEVSRSTLKHERNSIGGAEKYRIMFEKLLALARKVQRNGRPAIEDPFIRQQLAALEGRVQAHHFSSLRQLTRAVHKQDPGIVGLMNKLVTTEIGHAVAAIAQDLIGEAAFLAPDGRGNEKWLGQFMGSLGVAIAGGTSNIQRNIIAERGLGLPRE